MKHSTNTLLALALTSMIGVSTASAVNLITVDEAGNGNFNGNPLPSGLLLEPISGMTTLAYQLPFPCVQGDVQLIEVNKPQPNISDVIRFDGNFNMYFFSDTDGPPVDPADVGIPPAIAGLVTVTIPEVGPEGNNGDFYNPAGGLPGDNSAFATYNFISDAVPEPTTLALAGLAGLLLTRKRRRTQNIGISI